MSRSPATKSAGTHHAHTREGRGELPVAVDVAIPGEGAAKARSGELAPVEVDVGLCQPRRQPLGIDGPGEGAAGPWNHSRRLVAEHVVRAARRVSACGIEQAADGVARVALELRLGDPRRLEIELVVERGLVLRHGAGRTFRAARPERRAQADDSAEPVRPQKRGVPGDRRAPIVPDDDRPLRPERVDDADHVADEMQDRVFLDLLGTVGLAVAAHVGRDSMVAGLGERVQLRPPGTPGFGKAVTEDYERPGTRLRQMDADSVRLDRPMRDLRHCGHTVA